MRTLLVLTLVVSCMHFAFACNGDSKPKGTATNVRIIGDFAAR